VIYRPGPERLAPGLAPGGVIVHVYNLAGECLLESRMIPGDLIEAQAEADADRVAELAAGDVVLVAYDGDDGARYSARFWGAT
jgi:hypothetical protein